MCIRDSSKTERETAQRVIELAQAHGFAQYQRCLLYTSELSLLVEE